MELKVIKDYGGLYPKRARTIAHRAFWLIDREGIVRGRWLVDNAEIFPSEPILKAAREIAGKK